MSTATSKSSGTTADITDLIDQRRSGDFYRIADVLSPDEREVLINVRAFAEERVAPHPLGMSGARITGTAALELRETGTRFALATMCIGVGQGIAIALERV